MGEISRDLPVINASTALSSWRKLNGWKETRPADYGLALPRFMNLCAALPGHERAKLPPELAELVRAHRRE